jgi:hypothetical protein
MSQHREEAQFRRHLAEMRRAAGGIGRDFATEFSNLDDKIERFGHNSGKGAKYLGIEIQDDFARIGKAMDEEMRRLPQRFSNAGAAIGSGTVRAAGAVRDSVVDAGHRAKVGTRNALATAAGVKRTPIRQWSPPSADGPSDES